MYEDMGDKVGSIRSFLGRPTAHFQILVGSIIPVAPGRMRNIWYPRQKAEYMTESRLQQLNKKDLVIERDHTFGIEQPDSGNDIQELVGERLVDVEIKLLQVLQSKYHLRWAIALTIAAPKSNADHFHYSA